MLAKALGALAQVLKGQRRTVGCAFLSAVVGVALWNLVQGTYSGSPVATIVVGIVAGIGLVLGIWYAESTHVKRGWGVRIDRCVLKRGPDAYTARIDASVEFPVPNVRVNALVLRLEKDRLEAEAVDPRLPLKVKHNVEQFTAEYKFAPPLVDKARIRGCRGVVLVGRLEVWVEDRQWLSDKFVFHDVDVIHR